MGINLENRDFKGVWIPKDIWIDGNLSMLEKCIYVEIDSLDQGEGCFATNAYLAEFCQCSERKISDAIAKLENYGLITTEYVGRQRLVHSQGSKNCEAASQKLRGRVEETARQGSKNCDQNNIYDYKRELKNNSNNTPLPPKRFVKPSLAEIEAYCYERGNDINAEEFFNYYESVGWMVGGKKHMTDWRASVRYWESTRKKKTKNVDYEAMASEIAGGMI